MKILTDEEIGDINRDAVTNAYTLGEFARAIEAAILERIGDPVLWRFKHADDSDWKIAEPRNPYMNTVEDTVNEIKTYIDNGYKYELQALFAIKGQK